MNKFLIALVTLVAGLLVVSNVSALSGSISSVEVAGIEALSGNPSVGVFAGQTLPVRVIFSATENASDVRIKAWISGDSDYAVSSDRFDVISGSVYSKLLTLDVPSDLDRRDENLELRISVESRNNGILPVQVIRLATQRESYKVDVLDVAYDPKVVAGSALSLDIVLKNTGRQFADDTFVKASIPALGVERRVYFGDLAPVDQAHPDKEDAAERRMFLNIPARTPAGIYSIQIEVYNADSSSSYAGKVAVVGGSDDTTVVSTQSSTSVAANEPAEYSLTLVNSGNKVQVYELIFEGPAGLQVSSADQIVALPSGSTKTIKVLASAEKAGKYTFVVNVEADGNLVAQKTFTTIVEGSAKGANGTVVLTVVLAIIFVVLLVVLIVLLTRKPQKADEFGESYY
jgi:hypothetical protein